MKREQASASLLSRPPFRVTSFLSSPGHLVSHLRPSYLGHEKQPQQPSGPSDNIGRREPSPWAGGRGQGFNTENLPRILWVGAPPWGALRLQYKVTGRRSCVFLALGGHVRRGPLPWLWEPPLWAFTGNNSTCSLFPFLLTLRRTGRDPRLWWAELGFSPALWLPSCVVLGKS